MCWLHWNNEYQRGKHKVDFQSILYFSCIVKLILIVSLHYFWWNIENILYFCGNNNFTFVCIWHVRMSFSMDGIFLSLCTFHSFHIHKLHSASLKLYNPILSIFIHHVLLSYYQPLIIHPRFIFSLQELNSLNFEFTQLIIYSLTQ